MRSGRKIHLLLLTICILFVIMPGGCKAGKDTTTSQEGGAMPEIREYEGEKLSSINDFRENSIKGPQQVDISTYHLKISGLVQSSQEYTYDEVLANFTPHRKIITLFCVEGWKVKLLWEGVLVEDLLNAAGIQPEAKTVVLHSADGYTTSVELDYVLANHIMLAYKMNEVTLPPERGFPFQLAAEGKWGYKWAKWVTEIELSADENYRGFWEEKGYNQKGDLSGPIFEQ